METNSTQSAMRDEPDFYLYSPDTPSSPLHPGNVFYHIKGEQMAKALCRLFQREYSSEAGAPHFSLKSADEIELDEQILLDEALDWLGIYDDPDPGIYEFPPSKETMTLAQYAQRAHKWESLLAARKGDRKQGPTARNVEPVRKDGSSENQDNSAPAIRQNAKETANSQAGNIVKSAFISYSWDDDSHCEWVRQLAVRLRADGVNVSIDRWAAVPGDQLPAFMEHAIRENEFVIIICTPRYKHRSDTRKGGVGYEGDIMTAEAMTSQNQRKFIPVLRNGELGGSCAILVEGKVLYQPQRNPLLRTGL